MKVGQQIQLRMNQLGVSIPELAKRVGVSSQAVRHWVAGRSFPGKRHAPALESALSFNLDFTEGAGVRGGRVDANEIIERQDIELMMMVSRLDPATRVALRQLVETCLVSQSGKASFMERDSARPVEKFFDRARGLDAGPIKKSGKRASNSDR